MSVNQFIEDIYKPWLNVRVNDLTVDGDFVRSGSTVVAGVYGGAGDIPVVTVDSSGNITDITEVPVVAPDNSVSRVYFKPALEGDFVIDVELLPSMVPSVADRWYSAQFITFYRMGGDTKALKRISDVIFRVVGGNITDIRTSPYDVLFPGGEDLADLSFILTYSSPGGIMLRADVANLDPAPVVAAAGVATLIVSDVRILG